MGALTGAGMFVGAVVAGRIVTLSGGVRARGAQLRDIATQFITVAVVTGIGEREAEPGTTSPLSRSSSAPALQGSLSAGRRRLAAPLACSLMPWPKHRSPTLLPTCQPAIAGFPGWHCCQRAGRLPCGATVPLT